ncbi:MAG TPA: hypothetical protein VGR15_08730 [Bacteroidota bacterium]|jgi:hypothetical protein|nr:hypothetical protein [Bacteroidota bacterium]
MKYCFGLLVLLFTACAENPTATVTTAFNREFDLRVGQQATIPTEHVGITFLRVAEDSRCPDNSRCIWAGNGKIAVSINYSRFAPLDTSLNTYVQPQRVSCNGITVELLKLSPYPHAGTPILPGEYIATLKITKNG